MSVSNKVALYAMVPAAGILLFGLAAIAIYSTTIEAKVSVVSSIATSVTVLFLISERLRESARHKLEFLNKKALTPALTVGKTGITYAGSYQASVLTQCIEMLKHHGKFLKVKLYPKNLLNTIEGATNALILYDKLYREMSGAGAKLLGPNMFNIGALSVALGLTDKGNYADSQVQQHRVFLESLTKEEAKLGGQFREVSIKTSQAVGSIKTEIENFFVDNQLEEFREQPILGWRASYP